MTVDVQGVSTLAESVRVQRLLEGLPGARRVVLLATDAAGLRFRLDMPRGTDGVVGALSLRPELARVGAEASPLTYRFVR